MLTVAEPLRNAQRRNATPGSADGLLVHLCERVCMFRGPGAAQGSSDSRGQSGHLSSSARRERRVLHPDAARSGCQNAPPERGAFTRAPWALADWHPGVPGWACASCRHAESVTLGLAVRASRAALGFPRPPAVWVSYTGPERPWPRPAPAYVSCRGAQCRARCARVGCGAAGGVRSRGGRSLGLVQARGSTPAGSAAVARACVDRPVIRPGGAPSWLHHATR